MVNPVKEQELNIDQKSTIASESELTGLKCHQPAIVKDRNMAANSRKKETLSSVSDGQ